MEKKVKLSLSELTVKSFLTELKPKEKNNVRGGIYTVEFHPCNTNENGCIPHTEWPPFC